MRIFKASEKPYEYCEQCGRVCDPYCHAESERDRAVRKLLEAGIRI